MSDDGSRYKKTFIRNTEETTPENYADVCRVQGSLYTFEILFGRRSFTGSDQKEEMFCADQLLRMSPSHFKDFVVLCMQKILQYEEKFGVIPSSNTIHTLAIEPADWIKKEPAKLDDSENSSAKKGPEGGGLAC